MSESDQAEEPVMVIPMEADSESPTTALAA
jgi:hypothetical protein